MANVEDRLTQTRSNSRLLEDAKPSTTSFDTAQNRVLTRSNSDDELFNLAEQIQQRHLLLHSYSVLALDAQAHTTLRISPQQAEQGLRRKRKREVTLGSMRAKRHRPPYSLESTLQTTMESDDRMAMEHPAQAVGKGSNTAQFLTPQHIPT
jgi:hypothetical protein